MAGPWSAKGAKDPPLVASDQFLILDSNAFDPADENKRVTLDTVQSNLVTDVNANSFDLKDLSNLEFINTTGAPANSTPSIYADANGVTTNVPDGDSFFIDVDGTTEYSFSATESDFKENDLDNVGHLGIGTEASSLIDLLIENSTIATFRMEGQFGSVQQNMGTEFDITYNRISNGLAIMDIMAKPNDEESNAIFRFGLNSGSTGNNIIQLKEPPINLTQIDNLTQSQLNSSGGNTFLNARGGNVSIGTSLIGSFPLDVFGSIRTTSNFVIDNGGTQATGTVTCDTVVNDDTVTVNGLLYTAITGSKGGDNTLFDRSGVDAATASDLADSITNDTRVGDIPAIDQIADSDANIVTITVSVLGTVGNTVTFVSSSGTLEVSPMTGFLGGGVNADQLSIASGTLDGADKTVSFPDITADDTFALLGVAQTFTQNQTITFADDTITNGLTVQNSDGEFTFGNAIGTSNEFAAKMGIITLGNTNGFTTDVSITTSDTGTIPVSVLNLRQSDTTAVENRPLWQIQNNTAAQVTLSAEGRLGIGTSSPTQLLEVMNSAGAAVIRLEGSDAAVNHSVETEYDITYNRATGPAIMDFRATSGDSTSTYRFGINSGATANQSIRLFDSNTTMNVQAQIGSSGLNTYFNAFGGNFGLGLSNPLANLTGLRSDNDVAANSFEIRLQRELATGSVVGSDDSLGKITFFGAEDTDPTFVEGGRLEFLATQTWDDSTINHGTRFEISTTPEGGDGLPDIQLTIEQNGTADFEGNTITNIADIGLTSGSSINDENDNELIVFPATVTDAVNEITISNAATGFAPTITSSGESDIDLNIAADGTGDINLLNDVVLNDNILSFMDVDTSLQQSSSNLQLDVATGGSHELRVNNGTEYSFSATTLDILGNSLLNFNFIESNATIPSEIGIIRLGNGDRIAWRNNGNSDDFFFRVNSNDNFVFNLGGITYVLTSSEMDFNGKNAIDIGDIGLTSGSSINDANDNELIQFPATVGSAVNQITISNAATGVGPTITSSGESDIDLNIAADGTGNINLLNDVVFEKRYQGKKGAGVSSNTTITLGDGNYFDITGTNNISFMTVTNWQAGSTVTLQFDDVLNVLDGAIAGGGFRIAGDFSTSAGDTLTVVFDGTHWREISRSVN